MRNKDWAFPDHLLAAREQVMVSNATGRTLQGSTAHTMTNAQRCTGSTMMQSRTQPLTTWSTANFYCASAMPLHQIWPQRMPKTPCGFFDINCLSNLLVNHGRAHVRMNRYCYAHPMALHQSVAQRHVSLTLHQVEQLPSLHARGGFPTGLRHPSVMLLLCGMEHTTM